MGEKTGCPGHQTEAGRTSPCSDDHYVLSGLVGELSHTGKVFLGTGEHWGPQVSIVKKAYEYMCPYSHSMGI